MDSLVREISRAYPDAILMVASDGSHLAGYVAGLVTASQAAKALHMRKSAFLSRAKDQGAVVRAMVMHDRLQNAMWWLDEESLKTEETVSTPPLNSDTEKFKHAGCAVGKVYRTGKLDEKGKPETVVVGRELSFRGQELRIYPHVPLRWYERQLIGAPVLPDWGTKNTQNGNLKARLAGHSRDGVVLELHGEQAVEHCRRNPAHTNIPNTISKLVVSLAGSSNSGSQGESRQRIRPGRPCPGKSSAVLVNDGIPPALSAPKTTVAPRVKGAPNSLAGVHLCKPNKPHAETRG